MDAQRYIARAAWDLAVQRWRIAVIGNATQESGNDLRHRQAVLAAENWLRAAKSAGLGSVLTPSEVAG